ncbi:hypothetical protein N9Q18_01040 [bacterium]|nr:hypothetical protein [bacterium]
MADESGCAIEALDSHCARGRFDAAGFIEDLSAGPGGERRWTDVGFGGQSGAEEHRSDCSACRYLPGNSAALARVGERPRASTFDVVPEHLDAPIAQPTDAGSAASSTCNANQSGFDLYIVCGHGGDLGSAGGRLAQCPSDRDTRRRPTRDVAAEFDLAVVERSRWKRRLGWKHQVEGGITVDEFKSTSDTEEQSQR